MKLKSSFIVLIIFLFVNSVVLSGGLGHQDQDLARLYEQIEKNADDHLAFLQNLSRMTKQGEAAVQDLVAERFKALECEVEVLLYFTGDSGIQE